MVDEASSTFDRWLAGMVSEAATDERRRVAWLGHQAAEETTWAQIIAQLAEREEVIVLHTSAGRTHRGILEAVGRDFCALRNQAGRRVLATHRGILAVRSHRREGSLPEDLPSPWGSFADAIDALAVERPRISVFCSGAGAEWQGELESAGPDHLRLRLDGGDAAFIPYVSVAEVGEASG